ncbi:hypothetical protein [Aureispira sp. CCB-QB1]|uniref:hypothetical protein n=1 Tax=Aureispira sp. CCB-QB1 TaxID=1313421 RepID=UPI000696FF32|nr:hypothetical protein [Aureispira sp. CCB-QB1]
MFEEIIKAYDSKKCIKIAVKKQGGFFSNTKHYNVKVYTTTPRQEVPQEEADLKRISKLVLNKDWNKIDGNKEGYTHRTNLKEYPGLIILIKEIQKDEQ